MSGHSKWSTIKHKKEVTDAARGKVFSKLTRAIMIAIKSGGGPDPNTNYRLRMAIDTAKAVNMPKANIERALSKASEEERLNEITYEGFGPGGIAVIAEVVTDNRNRSGQEIKGIFERGGGQLAGPGAVSYNFEPKGMILLKSEKDSEDQMLKLIDMGVEDIEEIDDGIEVYVEPDLLSSTKDNLEKDGFVVTEAELVKKPKTLKTITDPKVAGKAMNFLEDLEEHDDVQKVFANLDIEENTIKEMPSVS